MKRVIRLAQHSAAGSNVPPTEPRCIYCGQPAHSDEHVIPRFLGEFSGFPHLTNRICSDCNNRFSRSERQLARSGPEALMRVLAGSHGRPEHSESAIFTVPSSGAPPIEAVFRDASLDADVRVQLGEAGFGEPLPCFYATDGNGHTASVLLDEGLQSREQLLARFAAAGLDHPRNITALVPQLLRSRAFQILHGTTGEQTGVTWEKWHLPSDLPPVRVTFRPTTPYYQAISKIAFHYMLSLCPSVSGAEACFSHLRDYIQYGDSTKCPVSRRRGTLLIMPRKAGPDYWSHVFMVTSEQGRLIVNMQLFVGPTGPTAPAWTVQLNHVPIRALVATPGTGTLFSYIPRADDSGYDCVAQPIPLLYLDDNTTL